MTVKALKGFSGAVTMHVGEIKNIENKQLLDDLLKAKYVEPVGEEKPKKTKTKKANKDSD